MQLIQPEFITGKYYYILESGRSGNLRTEILGRLHRERPHLQEVHNVEKCDVIFVFCPIASRAGTDIDAALKKLDELAASKAAVFLVLHHTYYEKVIPDSSRFMNMNINRMNMLTVDCLFHEDKGLLKCNLNDEAMAKIVRCFKPQEQNSYVALYIYRIIPFTLLCFALYKLYYWKGYFKTLLYQNRIRD